jgi:hypothetical protein
VSNVATEIHGGAVLANGWAVYSADGEALGSVAEIEEGFFKVNVPWGFDFYLRYDLIERSQDEVVHLRVTKSQLARERLATSVPPDSLSRYRDDFGDWLPDHVSGHPHPHDAIHTWPTP